MAFGKSTGIKHKLRNAVAEDQLWKANVNSEEEALAAWKSKWSWILDEYKELNKKLEAVTRSEIERKYSLGEDNRTIQPIPKSVNHEYGWVANIPNFRLDKWGSDVWKSKELPNIYKIVHD